MQFNTFWYNLFCLYLLLELWGLSNKKWKISRDAKIYSFNSRNVSKFDLYLTCCMILSIIASKKEKDNSKISSKTEGIISSNYSKSTLLNKSCIYSQQSSSLKINTWVPKNSTKFCNDITSLACSNLQRNERIFLILISNWCILKSEGYFYWNKIVWSDLRYWFFLGFESSERSLKSTLGIL